MTRLPLLGTAQRDTLLDPSGAGVPRRYVRGRVVWSAANGLAALNPDVSVSYIGRATSATIYDSRGVAITLAAAAAAFTSIDWNDTGARDCEGLLLSDEEALRFFDPVNGGGLWWPPGTALTRRFDWIHQDVDGPLWSFSDDDVEGAYLLLQDTGDGGVEWTHHNGSSAVTSSVAAAPGDRVSARSVLNVNGSVLLALSINGEDEVLGTPSAALTQADYWGEEWPCDRINELGTTTRGQQIARYSATYDGVLTRAELLERL